MDNLPLLGQSKVNACGSSLEYFIRRGLDALKRECYTESAFFFSLARTYISPDRLNITDTIDTFLQRYEHFQCAQHALQERSTLFSKAYTDIQLLAEVLQREMVAFVEALETVSRTAPTQSQQEEHMQEFLLPSSMQTLPTSTSLSFSAGQGESIESSDGLFITCFGQFEIKRNGKVLPFCPNRNGQGILRYLSAQTGYSATSDLLQGLFWPDEEAQTAKRKLHIAISSLRQSLNKGVKKNEHCQYILYKHSVYSLNADIPIQTDVSVFLQHYQAGQQNGEKRAAHFEHACSLYTGPFLLEDLYTDWSFLRREQLCQIYVTMCKALAEHYLQVREYDKATKWARAILQENRCDETAHQWLIRIYLLQGHRSDALRQYQYCEHVLLEELGLSPLPETTSLLQKLLSE